MNKVVIDPVTRIEGHLRMEAELSPLPEGLGCDGEVIRASSAGTMLRGLELILKGRDPREAWAFTQRICGVCTLVHGLGAVRAVEDALNYTLPPNAHLIRNLMLGAQYVHDHAMHFYHLHTMDWVDLLSALEANPADAALLQKSMSDWENNSTSYFCEIQEKLKQFVESGQPGIFDSVYWGHPAYRLPPHANLLFFAHYLEVLAWQREVVKLQTVFGGRNPHPNLVVGGMPCAISRGSSQRGKSRGDALLRGQTAVDRDGLEVVRSAIQQMDHLVNQLFIPDTLLLAESYKGDGINTGDLNDWSRIGEGLGNFMTFGEFPQTDGISRTGLLVPQGAILNRDLSTIYPVDPETPEQIQEYVSHSWYDYSVGKNAPLHPYDGETMPNYTGPSADRKDGYPDDAFDVEGSYSWIKSPRWSGHAMETGPLARINLMLASGNRDVASLINNALQRLELDQTALYSSLGRTLARNLETQLFSGSLQTWYDQLVCNIESGDLDTFNDEFWDPSTWPAEARGVGLVEAPRGALAHYMVIEDGKIANYQAVVPTTWNGSPRDADGQGGAMEMALAGHRIHDRERPIELLRTIHTFDPCIACAVHVASPKG